MILVSLAVSWTGPAWADGFSPDDYVMQVWDTDSGLPDSTVISVVQTPDGYLWVGTLHGGLARFDGVRFVDFQPGNTPELKSVEMHKLFVDAQGTLWINNVEGGLISYRDNRFHFEYLNNETPGSWVEDLLADRPGELEFASRSGAIFRRRSGAGTNAWDAIPPPKSAPAAVCQDASGVTWYLNTNGTLARLQGGKLAGFSNPPGLHGVRVRSLVKDAGGKIWVGTARGIALWDQNTFVDMTPTNGEAKVAVNQLYPCPDGSLWVLTGDQLRRCGGRRWLAAAKLWDDPETDRAMRENFFSGAANFFVDSGDGIWFVQDQKGMGHVRADGEVSWVQDTQHVLTGTLRSWFEDHEGNIWIGLADGGLVRLRPRIFHPVQLAEGVDAKTVWSACEGEDGTMWFGTARYVWHWNREPLWMFSQPASDWFEEIKVLPAGGGRVWVGSVGDGLLELADGQFSRPFPAADIGSVVRCLYCDRQGALWIGSEFGLFRWDKNGLKTFSARDGFSPAYVLAIAEDPAGGMWFGTALGELRHFSNGKFETFLPPDSLTDPATLKAAAAADPFGAHSRGTLSGGERFWALHFDGQGALWIGTLGGGLLRFQDGRFFRFTTRDDLPTDNISQILEDNHGRLWLGTSVGIVRVTKRELNEYAAGGKTTPVFVTYGKFDGLPALECTGGTQPDCWRGRDGRLWFSTVKGAVWVDPANLHRNHQLPPVHIEEFSLDGHSQVQPGFSASQPAGPPPEKIRIPAGRHYFEFKFSALSLTSPDKVKFKWRLAGLEKDWVDGGNRRNANYSFVPPGDYRFEVLACNNDGFWCETPAVMELTVLPYFWQQWWFRLAAALGVAAALAMIYSIRVHRLQMLERLRLRIARDLHDEVGANLGSISLLAQIMEKDPSRNDAAQVRGIALQTIETLRDIIWFIDPTHDNLSDLVTRLQETARVMLSAVRHTFEASGDFRQAGLSPAFRRNVPALFKETLHNLLKHSGATEVSIVVSRVEKGFQFRVRDNGSGFDPGIRSSGNGLKNLKRRAEEIGGQLTIETAPGAGTTVTLSVPLTGPHHANAGLVGAGFWVIVRGNNR